MLERASAWLRRVDLSADLDDLPESNLTFADGGRFRIEIPEVENAEVFEVMLRAADEFGVPVHRVSQGTGITRLSDRDLRELHVLGIERGIDVFLFIGVRGENGAGAQARSPAGGSSRKRLQGGTQLLFALEDVRRALDAGIRGLLVSDEGLMSVLHQLRELGEIPSDVAMKTSVAMGHGNPASARVLYRLGANSFNLPVDLSLGAMAAIRQAVPIPLDLYVEAPAGMGGGIRFYELPGIVRVASPVHLKFGLATEVATDPVGVHLQSVANLQVRERVRLAAIGLEVLERAGLIEHMSPAGGRAQVALEPTQHSAVYPADGA